MKMRAVRKKFGPEARSPHSGWQAPPKRIETSQAGRTRHLRASAKKRTKALQAV